MQRRAVGLARDECDIEWMRVACCVCVCGVILIACTCIPHAQPTHAARCNIVHVYDIDILYHQHSYRETHGDVKIKISVTNTFTNLYCMMMVVSKTFGI